ncbi:hypothetical protein Tco_0357213, partial [Tanacetum coccineum]
STVTYTVVSSPFADLPYIGSPGVDGPLMMPEDPYAYVVAAFQVPPSPDYVPGPKHPPLLDFVPKPVYPEFMPPEDEVLPAEEQPLPATISPTADSPGYVPKSDPEKDPEEDDDKDLEEDPVDEGDNGDDEDESSDDDEDEDVDIKGDEEEEEHPTPADSTAVALPTVDQAPYAEETGPFETDESAATPPPHPAYRVARLLAIPTPPPSPLSPWSSPLPQIPLPPLPVSSPVHVTSSSPPASPIHRPEVTLPPRKRLGIALGLRYEVGESSSAPTARPPRGIRVDYGFVAIIDREIMRDLERDVCYGITDTWDEMLVDMPGAPVTDDTEDRRTHARTARLIEVVAQQAVIIELQAADRRTHDDGRLRDSRGTIQRSHAQPDAPEEAETTNTTSVTNAQLQAMIDQGVTAALAARDANRSTNGDDSHNSGTGELALLCGRMFPEESDKIEKYVGGLPDMIHGSVVASKPKTIYNNNNRNKRQITGWAFKLQRTGEKNNIWGSNTHMLFNETITTTVHVLPDATSAIKSAIWLVTAGALQPLTMLTIRGALDRVRSLLAMSVEFRDILRGNVPS